MGGGVGSSDLNKFHSGLPEYMLKIFGFMDSSRRRIFANLPSNLRGREKISPNFQKRKCVTNPKFAILISKETIFVVIVETVKM